MALRFERFQATHYPEYAAWFADPTLNRQLGPMDETWLQAILAETEAEGLTWAVFQEDQFVAVIETAFDTENRARAFITAIATRPSLRRQGLGLAVLRQVIERHNRQGITEHTAYVSQDNQPARRCVEKAGFVAIASAPNEHGYLEFHRAGSP